MKDDCVGGVGGVAREGCTCKSFMQEGWRLRIIIINQTLLIWRLVSSFFENLTWCVRGWVTRLVPAALSYRSIAALQKNPHFAARDVSPSHVEMQSLRAIPMNVGRFIGSLPRNVSRCPEAQEIHSRPRVSESDLGLSCLLLPYEHERSFMEKAKRNYRVDRGGGSIQGYFHSLFHPLRCSSFHVFLPFYNVLRNPHQHPHRTKTCFEF